MTDLTTVSIATSLSGLDLSSCLYNASGAFCRSQEQLDILDKSDAGAILSKSCTAQPRIGNARPRYYHDPFLSINSMGLPNNGSEFYLSRTFDKPYIVSINGQSEEELLYMLNRASDCANIQGIELNLSCPNVIGRPQVGYDFEMSEMYIRKAREVIDSSRHVFGIKLPPYFDYFQWDSMANIINTYRPDYLTCVNSLGNGLVIDVATESTVIHPKNGHGGIGGIPIKPIALSNVRQFYLRCPGIDVVGCGGVSTGRDAFEHILAGARAVQIGTQLMREGTQCFTRISHELKELMAIKQYSTIEEFQGKLLTCEISLS